jgi:hypothetical protein
MAIPSTDHQAPIQNSWAQNMLKTALDVNVHLNKAQETSNHETFKDILKAYVQCNRLMFYLIKAYQNAEISRSEFLDSEIQLKELMSRLESASEKISNDINC